MNYNQIMQKAGKEIEVSLFYGATRIGPDSVIKAKPYFNCGLVGTIMKGLELELTEELPRDDDIYFHVNASYGTDEALSIRGPYYVKEAEYKANTKTYVYQLYDEFIRSMVDYEPIEIDYPCTVLEFFNKLVTSLGWTTNIDELPNGSRIIDHDIYDGIGYTYRSVLEDIGQATGTLFRINDGVIEDSYIVNAYLNTEEPEHINTADDKRIVARTSLFRLQANVKINDSILRNQNIDFGEHFGPINSIVLTRSADSDSIYMRDETQTYWNEFRISDNQLMNDNNRAEYLEELYARLYGIEYDVFDTQLVGYGLINPLQKVEFTTNDKQYVSYIFNCEEEFTQGYRETIYTDYPDETTTDYKAADKQDNINKQTYIIVNKQKQQIESLVQTTEDLGDGINNNSLQISQVIQDAKGLTGYFANASGAKYIKMSAEGLQVSRGDDSSSVTITEDGVFVKNDDQVVVATMKKNEFDTTTWVMSETRNGNCMNIFKRRT